MGQRHHMGRYCDLLIGEVGDVPGHPAGLQGLDHVVIVYQAAPGQVQDPDLTLHLGNGLRVDKVLGAVVIGDVDGDVVGHPVQLIHIFHHMDMAVQAQGGLHRQEGVIAVHIHPQLQGDVAHQRADGPQADDAQGLAVQLRPSEGGLSLLHRGGQIHPGGVDLLLHPLRAAQNVPGGDEQGGQNQFLDRVGVGAGGVEHHDAVFRAAVDGDVVGPRPRPGDGPQLLREHIVVHGGGADQDAVLVLHLAAHLEACLIQQVQAGAGNLI